MKYIFLFFTVVSFGQKITRSTISSSGASSLTNTGYYVSQSIGQLSTIGFSETQNKSIIIGYQQPHGYKTVNGSITKETLKIYPVPVTDKLNVLFSMTFEGKCTVELFDRLGRLVFSKECFINGYKTSVTLTDIPSSSYIIKITNNNSVFYENIIKKD